MANFKKGDRIKVKGTPHMEGQKTGEIVEVSSETPYSVKFDGMDMTHKWYVDSEIEATDEKADDMDRSGGVSLAWPPSRGFRIGG